MTERHITLVITDISKPGGTERVATDLANSLAGRGYRVSIIALQGGKPYFRLNHSISVNVVRDFRYYSLSSMRKLKGSIEPASCVIVISMTKLSSYFILFSLLWRINNPIILSEHISFLYNSRFYRYLKVLAYKRAAKVTVLTDYDYRLLRRHVKTVVRIPNYSTVPGRDPMLKKTSQNVALAIGRLVPQKGFDRLLRIWAVSRNEGWMLRIVGDGPELSRLKLAVSELGLEDRVAFVSPTKNIEVEYLGADMLLMTSRAEGLPLVLIEAKFYGLPAIAYDCLTGPRDIIEHNVDGYLIRDDDEDTFVYYLDELMRNDTLRLELSNKAYQHRFRYSESTIMASWLKIIEESCD